ncbi:RNA polymerase sigma factor SigM [Solicola sp. PLA-1-18]|uniref:RNA polymerase sigma factor SigM n=1 Tax=Solicola sp. PLA-1-18 TaxID=3380532 RepID=UPI003B81F6ED
MSTHPATTAASTPTDAELLARHVAGDPHAFGDLVGRHQDRLWAVAVRTMRDREDAADALQDAMVKAFGSAHRYRGDSAVTTWLHRIVVNACIDAIRRQRVRPAVRGLDLELVPGPTSERETVLDVRAAVAALPDAQQRAVVMVYLQGYSVEETARVLGCAAGTVKSRCARARDVLGGLLADGHAPVAA